MLTPKRSKTLDQPDKDVEMSFFDHLEALRWHLIRSLAVVVILTILAFVYKDFVFGTVFMGPSRPSFITYRILCNFANSFSLAKDLCVDELKFTLMNTEMGGQFMQHIYISFSVGVVMAVPYFTYEIWRFIRPALSNKEVKGSRGVTSAATILFLIGIAFGYYVILPITIQFLANYELDPSIKNNITISNYISMLTMTTLSIALVFELPIVVYFLSRSGILTPKLMRSYRKHAIVVILILSAIITPSTDILSQIVVAVPFYLLYESSIAVSFSVDRRRKKREALNV
ncbi:MAG: twin-arginine translocase subunit TatC [Bacteroidota bacterium]|nr:twin-arginine translocase subunit TatC [Bacteroidota bacterium]